MVKKAYENIEIATKQLRFHALSMGEGDLVLCLHGFPDIPHSFLPLMEQVSADGYRVVAPYSRGYFPSESPKDKDFSIYALGNDVVEICKALGYDKAILIGHDWGATACYTASILDPKRFPIVVAAVVPHLRSIRIGWRQLLKSWYILFFQIPLLPEWLLSRNHFAAFEGIYRRWSPAKSDAWDLSELKKVLAHPQSLGAMLGYYRSLFRHPRCLRKIFAPVPAKTLVLAGAEDGSIGIELFEKIKDGIAGPCTLKVLAPEGHFLHIENPQAFVKTVRLFLAEA